MPRDRKPASFDEAMDELRAVIGKNPQSISGQYMLERIREAEDAHAVELECAHHFRRAAEESCRAYYTALERLTPNDSHGEPVWCGTFIETDGTICPVCGVDDVGGVFYLTDGNTWEYTLASLTRRVDVLLDEEDPSAAVDLKDLSRDIRAIWDDLGCDDERMEHAIDRLTKMASARWKQETIRKAREVAGN